MIKNYSKHLESVLIRKLGSISNELEESFEFSYNHGGASELGFIRPTDQSYNPRLARICLIGVQTDQRLTEDDVNLLLLSPCLDVDLTSNLEKIKKCNLKFQNNLHDINKILSQVNKENTLTDVTEISILCSLSLYIDKIRHAHLVSADQIKTCLSEALLYKQLAKKTYPNFLQIINTWENRFKKQND